MNPMDSTLLNLEFICLMKKLKNNDSMYKTNNKVTILSKFG